MYHATCLFLLARDSINFKKFFNFFIFCCPWSFTIVFAGLGSKTVLNCFLNFFLYHDCLCFFIFFLSYIYSSCFAYRNKLQSLTTTGVTHDKTFRRIVHVEGDNYGKTFVLKILDIFLNISTNWRTNISIYRNKITCIFLALSSQHERIQGFTFRRKNKSSEIMKKKKENYGYYEFKISVLYLSKCSSKNYVLLLTTCSHKNVKK